MLKLKGVVRFLRRSHPSSTRTSLVPRGSCVRIIHAGGREELYLEPVSAFQVMEKYPGMLVARPQVFRQPHDSILWPQETLNPGEKYYMIPSTTAKKLKRGYQPKGCTAPAGSVQDQSEKYEPQDSSREECYGNRARFFRRRKVMVEKEHFVPPIPVQRASKIIGWEPSLSSVKELST